MGKAYASDYEDIVFTYEVIENEDDMPKTVYTAKTTDRLTGILYTIRSGAYRYSENDAIPEGKDVGRYIWYKLSNRYKGK